MMLPMNRNGLDTFVPLTLNALKAAKRDHSHIRVFQGMLHVILEDYEQYFRGRPDIHVLLVTFEFLARPEVIRKFSDVSFMQEFFKPGTNYILLNENDRVEYDIVNHFDPDAYSFDPESSTPEHKHLISGGNHNHLLVNESSLIIKRKFCLGITDRLVNDGHGNYYKYLND